MHVIEHLTKAKHTLLSYEVLPPLKGKTIKSLFDHIDPLMEFKPSWINVTYHRSETIVRTKEDGSTEMVDVRKRPLAAGLSALLWLCVWWAL